MKMQDLIYFIEDFPKYLEVNYIEVKGDVITVRAYDRKEHASVTYKYELTDEQIDL